MAKTADMDEDIINTTEKDSDMEEFMKLSENKNPKEPPDVLEKSVEIATKRPNVRPNKLWKQFIEYWQQRRIAHCWQTGCERTTDRRYIYKNVGQQNSW